MSARTSHDPAWDAWQLRIANEAAGVALWSWNMNTDVLTMDARAHRLWGVPNSASITFEQLSSRIHPEDIDRVREAFSAMREVVGAYETDFRVSDGDQIRWISVRGRGDDTGIVGRVMFGVFIDVSVRKFAEEASELIAHEMNHRIKNLFSIAKALTNIASRSTSTKDEMTQDLSQRLVALSAAHDLVRADLGEPRQVVSIGDLLRVLLEPYADKSSHADRVRVTAPEIPVGESSVTAMALIVHELATNAIKYGALSSSSGALEVSCADQDGDIVLVWRETGGPPVVAPRERKGFGSQLVSRSVSGQLGGSIESQWPVEGAIITLRVSKARLGV